MNMCHIGPQTPVTDPYLSGYMNICHIGPQTPVTQPLEDDNILQFSVKLNNNENSILTKLLITP